MIEPDSLAGAYGDVEGLVAVVCSDEDRQRLLAVLDSQGLGCEGMDGGVEVCRSRTKRA